MPKELTHWILAERARQALPEDCRLKRLLTEHRAAYLGGAVLPDTPLHIFRGPFHPTARNLGNRLHNPAGNSYAPLLLAERRLQGELPPRLLSSLLGVISHLEADAALHPYIYAATAAGGIGEHYRLETQIDRHFMQLGAMPPQRTLDRLLTPADREALVQAACLLFAPDAELPRQAMAHSLALHCRFQSLYDRLFWKLAVRVLARVCGSPFREQQHLFYPLLKVKGSVIPAVLRGAWRHPETGELQKASLEELAGKAVENTVAALLRVEEKGSLAAALEEHPGANPLTGLHGVQKGPL
jgi:hypothetical protein